MPRAKLEIETEEQRWIAWLKRCPMRLPASTEGLQLSVNFTVTTSTARQIERVTQLQIQQNMNKEFENLPNA
jgi:hypothetical protein